MYLVFQAETWVNSMLTRGVHKPILSVFALGYSAAEHRHF